MKRLSVFLCSLCLFMAFGLTACGSDEAKVTGICAGVGTEQINPFVYGNPLWDDTTIAEDDYNLQVGKSYLFGVTYAQYGGSKIRSMLNENVLLKYDNEVLEIVYSNNGGEVAFYNLTCKTEIAYTAIIVEVDGKYSSTVIISAK